jgi:hypothetical protein
MFVPCYLQKNRKKIHILRILIVDYLLTPSVSMFIGQGLSLEARHAAQAERRSANTATAPASAAAAAAAASTAATAATKRASSASPPLFTLSPPAEMDSIASPPTGASTDGPSPASMIVGSLTSSSSLAPLVYAEEFYLKHNRSREEADDNSNAS